MVTFDKEPQFLKIPSLIVVILFGRVIVVIPELLKASVPILDNPSGRVKFFKEEQP